MHGRKFMETWGTFVNDKPCTIRAYEESKGTTVVVAEFEGGIDPDFGIDLALELGEFFYQLRAALDAATFKFASLISAPHPPANETTLEFPIYPSPKKFQNSAFNREPFPNDLKVWVESIQPYNASKTADKPYFAINKFLSVIHDCARKDRHRHLHVVAAYPTSMTGEIILDGPGNITFTEAIPCNFLENKFEFLRVGFDETFEGKIDLKGQMVIDVSVDEIPGVRGTSLADAMNVLAKAAGFVVNAFENIYLGRPLDF